jgi:hypothetical protein
MQGAGQDVIEEDLNDDEIVYPSQKKGSRDFNLSKVEEERKNSLAD